MNALTIKQALSLTPQSPVLCAGGMIKGIGQYETGPGADGAQWSLQELMLEDPTGTIPVRLGNKPEIGRDELNTVVYFVSHKKANGGLSGVRIDEEEGIDGGANYKYLAVARSAEILTEAQYMAHLAQAKQNASQAPAPAPATAAPAANETRPANPGDAKPKMGAQITELRYEKLVNTERLGITVSVDAGTKPSEALEAAKAFVSKHLPKEVIPQKSRAVPQE